MPNLAPENPVLPLRSMSEDFFSPEQYAREIRNFMVSEAGTLVPVVGPIPAIPSFSNSAPTDLGTVHGVGSFMLDDVSNILVHSGTGLRYFHGPSRTWSLIFNDMPDPQKTAVHPTKFIPTGTGCIIIPAGGGLALYWGKTRDGGWALDHLGYTETPSAPQVEGPKTVGSFTGNANNSGFKFDVEEIHPDFGWGKLGDISSITNEAGNFARVLNPAIYEWSYRWIDEFNNLSPLSPRSNEVRWVRQTGGSAGGLNYLTESRLKFAAIKGIQSGPQRTTGRICYRTTNIATTGVRDLLEIPNGYGNSVSGAFATLPGNVVNYLPDNTPDAHLGGKPDDVLPMPEVFDGAIAFQRAWFVDKNDRRRIVASLPGLWGTIDANVVLFPDPYAEVQAVYGSGDKLLVLTNKSVFRIVLSDDGTTFQSALISRQANCVAPASVCDTGDGGIMWLGQDELYYMPPTMDSPPVAAGHAMRETLKKIVWSRAHMSHAVLDPKTKEYRLYIPIKNDLVPSECLVYRAAQYQGVTQEPVPGWTLRNDGNMRCSTVVAEWPFQVFLGGEIEGLNTVWVADREDSDATYTKVARTYTIETVWIEAPTGPAQATPRHIYLYLKEWAKLPLGVITYIDARHKPKMTEIYQPGVRPDDPSAIWNVSTWGDSDSFWSDGSPYWVRVPLPENLTSPMYKFRFSSALNQPFEFIALSFAVDRKPGVGNVMKAVRIA